MKTKPSPRGSKSGLAGRRSSALRDPQVWMLLSLALLVAASWTSGALARPGGGESYSGGGGGGSGGGSGGGGEIGILIDLVILCIHYPALGIPLLIIASIFFIAKARHERKNKSWSAGVPQEQVRRAARPKGVTRASLERIKQWDSGFSVVLFEDFLYTLYSEMHRSRANAQVSRLGPYVSPTVQQAIGDPSLQAIEGVVIGAMRYTKFHNTNEHVEITAEFESNLTELRGGQRKRWYVVDRVTLRRGLKARSRRPERSRTLDCPSCGAPLEAIQGNVCSYCREQVADGRFDWSITALQLIRSEARPPLLLSNVDEVGTNFPTLVDSGARNRFAQLSGRDPDVSEAGLHARVGLIFNELQAGWSQQDLPRIRPFVSDNLFQYFAYWIDMYRELSAKNISEKSRITRIELANVLSDAFYDSVTLRVYATGLDYTTDNSGKLLKGSRKHERAYSEYWTLIRGTTVRGKPRLVASCPSCGAPLKVSMAGNCEYCAAKVISGDFDWVLSRIEQDESYGG